MLRVFRGLKAIKHSSQCFIEEKLFNSIAIIVILIMIVVSIIVSNFVDKRLHSFVDDNYRQILRAIVITSKTEEGKFSAEQFIEKLKMLDRVIYYKISLDTLDKPIENYISITKEELTHKYFPDDIYEISLNNKIVIKILIKELKFYVRIVEMLVLISALPLIAILLITLHLIILKYYIAPIHKINEVLETNLEQELKLIELDEKLQGSDIYQLQEKINNTLENNNTKLWEYYNAYEELRKKEQGE